eukprot:gene31322-35760_t
MYIVKIVSTRWRAIGASATKARLSHESPIIVTVSDAPSAGLAVRAVAKRFGSTEALRGVDFDVAPGEIVGLMGANGAGKSTLANILAGVVLPDRGTVTLDGRPFAPRTPREAISGGIVASHQEPDRAGSPGLTVADALVLDRLADGRSGWFVSTSSIRRAARTIVDR